MAERYAEDERKYQDSERVKDMEEVWRWPFDFGLGKRPLVQRVEEVSHRCATFWPTFARAARAWCFGQRRRYGRQTGGQT
jgi:hypothetical protein